MPEDQPAPQPNQANIQQIFDNIDITAVEIPEDAVSTLAEEAGTLDLDRKLELALKMQKLLVVKYHIDGMGQDNQSKAQNLRERKKYATGIFWFTCGWAVVLLAIIVLVGLGIMTLESNVLITLITSTTINAFGFFYIVVKYLFNIESANPNLPTLTDSTTDQQSII